MKTLIIGGRGLVGSALSRQLPDALCGISIEPKKNTNQIYTDVTKYETLFKVFSQYRPNIVYMPASITNVDKCEEYSTDVVNVRGAITVLRLCESFESKFVYFSSSYVFDGKKKSPYTLLDETAPLNNYGKQKVIVENQILESGANALIVRTVGVYGPERMKKNFAKSVIASIFSGRKVFAPIDQKMNPILSVDLAKITIQLASKQTGLWHVAGDTCVSKYEFARKIAAYFGLENLVEPKTTEEMNQRAERPRNGCLDCNELKRVGIEVPSFDAGLIKFLSLEYNG